MSRRIDETNTDRQRAAIYEALGHPRRLTILKLLKESPLGFAELKRSARIESNGVLAFHLEKLNNLIETDQYGKYCLSEKGKDALLNMESIETSSVAESQQHGLRSLRTLRPNRRTVLLAASLIAILLVGFGIGYIFFNGSRTNPGSNNLNFNLEAYSYILSVNGSTYYSRDCRIGVVSSSSNLASHLTSLFSNLTSTGGAIFFQQGTYLFTAPVFLPSRVSVYGDMSAILQRGFTQANNGGLFILSNVHDVTIQGLTFYGNRGIYKGSAIWISGGVSRIVIKDNYINAFYYEGINAVSSLGSGGNGALYSLVDSIIANNIVKDTFWEGMVFANVTNLTITGNVINGTGNDGILVTGHSSSIILSNNVIANIGSLKSGAWNMAHGITVSGVDGYVPASSIIISGNTIHQARMSGICVTDQANNLTISENIIDHCGLAAEQPDNAGIYFGGGLAPSYWAGISNNLLSQNYQGILIHSDVGHPRTIGVTISGNTVIDSTLDGILIGNSMKVSIANNMISSNKGWGLAIENDSANILVLSNSFIGNLAGPIGGNFMVNEYNDVKNPEIQILKPTLLFSDDFESGDFRQWNGSEISTKETMQVKPFRSLLGAYGGRATSNGDGGTEWAYCSKLLSTAELSARGAFYIANQSGLVEDGDAFSLILLRAGDREVASVGWAKLGGMVLWTLTLHTGTENLSISSTTSPSLNRYYSVELHWKADALNGMGQLWVDGVLVCSLTGRNTSTFGWVSDVRFGLPLLTNCSSTIAVYFDCVKIATAWIGSVVNDVGYQYTLFRDDFESGNFDRWSSASSRTFFNSGNLSVVNTVAAEGSYSSLFTAGNATSLTGQAYCYKSLYPDPLEFSSLGFDFTVKIASLEMVGNGSFTLFRMLKGINGTVTVASVGWTKVGGVLKWSFTDQNGLIPVIAYSQSPTFLNTWYEVRVGWDPERGDCSFSVDNLANHATESVVLHAAPPGDTSLSRIDYGLPFTVNCRSVTVYCDSCAITGWTYDE